MRLFCTYCGKDFSRKEHLERHIPRHTNVKPYRCLDCNMSYSRKDLLQRHMSFHQLRSPAETGQGVPPVAPGRTPIACQNCANAKTGCDKRVPCSRCAEKGLTCAARYARRSMKAAARVAQASDAYSQQVSSHDQSAASQQQPPAQPRNHAEFASPELTKDAFYSFTNDVVDLRMPEFACGLSFLSPVMPGSAQQPEEADDAELVGDTVPCTADLGVAEGSYQDMLLWSDYPMDFNLGGHDIGFGSVGDAMPHFGQVSDISSSSEPQSAPSRFSTNTRRTSVGDVELYFEVHCGVEKTTTTRGPTSALGSVEAVAAESAWPLGRCNTLTFSGSCPRTALAYLESLGFKSKNESTWTPLEEYLTTMDLDQSDLATLAPITQRTRDTMLAVTQSVLHKALEIHHGGSNGQARMSCGGSNRLNFIVLPPTKILRFLLYTFARSFSTYFPLLFAGTLDANEMVASTLASNLLVLFMVARGAMAVPTPSARILAIGLTEACRISLFDLIEKNVELSADLLVQQCGLLFTITAAWSGDKWLMDIAMGQRGMYLAMIRHAGLLAPGAPTPDPFANSREVEGQWRAWLHRESRSRIVYNWVMADLELSSFHDAAPTLAITDLKCPLPGPETLWRSPDAQQWACNLKILFGIDVANNYQAAPGPLPEPSLYSLFQQFLHGGLAQRRPAISLQQLRLLLYPLYALVRHTQQFECVFRDPVAAEGRTTRRPNSIRSAVPYERGEQQPLLRSWYNLAIGLDGSGESCGAAKMNVVLYHLIVLETVTDFLQVESLARREYHDGSMWDLAGRYERCVFDRHDAWIHCGQVFRLLRLMRPDCRPCWSAAAIYRATLILWADSTLHQDAPVSPARGQPAAALEGTRQADKHPAAMTMPTSASVLAIDQIAYEDGQPNHASLAADWVAILTRRDGTTVTLDRPQNVLEYGQCLLDEGCATGIADGMKRKLVALGQAWAQHTMA